MTYFIAAVWLINGLFCKVFRWVPRHEQIVSRILGPRHARPLTILIGLLETCMAAWIVTGIAPRWNAWVQIVVIAFMNTLEFFLAPDLLLWGRWNALFAALFLILVYAHVALS